MSLPAASPDRPSPKKTLRGRLVLSLRALLRSSELALVAAASLVGLVAALCVTAMTQTAIAMHILIFKLPFDVRLSAVDRISPWAAFGALSLGGLSLGLMESWRLKHKISRPVDPIEANALRGGRMSLRDSFVVGMQTLISNSVGASVGLEAGYAQVGSALGSFLGQKLHLRRSDLRLLVGAGAAGAIGGSFGAPLTGAFYAFEIILGAYSIAGAGPIFAASIVGVLTTHFIAGAPYQIPTSLIQPLTLPDYPLLFGLAACSAAFGISAMRAAGVSEKALESTHVPVWARPVIGGTPGGRSCHGHTAGSWGGAGRSRAQHCDSLPPLRAGGRSRSQNDGLPDLSRRRVSRRPVFRLAAHGRPSGQDLCSDLRRAHPRCRARSDHLHSRGDGDDGRRDRRRTADHVFPGSRKHRRFFSYRRRVRGVHSG